MNNWLANLSSLINFINSHETTESQSETKTTQFLLFPRSLSELSVMQFGCMIGQLEAKL